MIPFVRVIGNELDKKSVRHVAVERGDYIGKEVAGPIMAVRTERADGSNDCTVFAPAATGHKE